ncbi:MAG: hypothetical protein RL199_1865 [Pseudomonadota bacterium]|jgi:hypothetical protein
MRAFGKLLLDALASLKLTILLLSLLMLLVVACTLDQVSMGTLGAVNANIRSWFVWWHVPGTGFSVAVFPGGALVGALLLANLVVAQLRRLQLTRAKAGIWLTHAGLILLIAGEFVTGLVQTESRLEIVEGETVDFIERPREFELVLVDASDPVREEVWKVFEGRLSEGWLVRLPASDLTLNIKRYLPNVGLRRREESDPPALADHGVGADLVVERRPPVTRDDMVNQPAVLVEPLSGLQSYGTWLVSTALGAPQSFLHGGHSYRLEMRNRRETLPFSMTLKKFSHDVYPGTDIPKNFSSLVHLSNASTNEERDVLISMNHPLRYLGKAYYQASFGRGDTLSVLQVVDNSGWLIPYISCVLVTLGLLVHFSVGLERGLRRSRRTAPAVAPKPEASVELGV